MDNPLDGRTIVITGAASGLGRAWAKGFAAEGARVIAADIDAERLAELNGIAHSTCVTDVSRADDICKMIALAMTETGRIDVLFNNAGLGFTTRIEDLNDGQFEHHLAVHLFGAISGMRYAIPEMRRQGYGRIINTVSRAAEFASPGNSAYAAAKAAIWAASRSAAVETADADILINMLIPGPTNTAIWRRDRPELQSPEATYPTAKMLATLPPDGPRGQVFWNEQIYPLFAPANQPA